MAMPNRQIVNGEAYRYGYQGEFAETDPETGKVAFQLRLYDPRINRWMTTDPYNQYPSPYVGMGNDWVNGIDPDGGFKTKFGAWLYRLFNGGGGEIFQNDYGDWGISKTYFDKEAGVDGLEMTFGWKWEEKNVGNGMPWMDLALGELGTSEFAGTDKNNPRIMEYLKTTGSWWKNDETPWCSAFCNWATNKSGNGGTNSARAIDWNKWKDGTKHNTPVLGSIAVISYGNGSGHVGFVVGKSGNRVVLLGGNQGNKVKLSAFGTSKIIGYIVPKSHQAHHTLLNLGGNYKTLNYGSTR